MQSHMLHAAIQRAEPYRLQRHIGCGAAWGAEPHMVLILIVCSTVQHRTVCNTVQHLTVCSTMQRAIPHAAPCNTSCSTVQHPTERSTVPSQRDGQPGPEWAPSRRGGAGSLQPTGPPHPAVPGGEEGCSQPYPLPSL